QKYKSAGQGNYDIYVVFVERALGLLNTNGRVGLILPHKFFNAQYGRGLRSIIATQGHLSHIVHFGDQQVFGATTYTCLLFLNSQRQKEFTFESVRDLAAWRSRGISSKATISLNEILGAEWNFSARDNANAL